jgi:2-iminobutanoate/2-iminopropanoate deaminase
MNKKVIKSKITEPWPFLSSAVEYGGVIYASGVVPYEVSTGKMKTGSIEEQTRVCLENLKEVLRASNSSLELVLKIQVYCSNSAHYERFNKVYIEYFPKDPPARTFITVGSFPIDFDVEIDAIAAVKI